ncbi:MAG: serine/threonine-protein kinase [Planctomycetota bacterium]
MSRPEDELDPLERLLEECTQAIRAGQKVDIEDWARRHPEQAEGIRELFPTILAVEGLKADSDSARKEKPQFGFVDRLGDYRIVDEIGRGGMGVVYEAEQESLGRRVAVKVLPPMRDARRMQRFEREARTAARLHHTNIVPIFGVGEHEGWHYYVMPLIRGVGLDAVLHALRGSAAPETKAGRGSGTDLTPSEAALALRTGRFRPLERGASSIDGKPSSGSESGPRSGASAGTPEPEVAPAHATNAYWRSVARIAHQVADALGYAHAQGVLHRDVKPGNLLLDAHGVVWVTDFGLAKAVGSDGLTMSGDLVGTLQYMAPEQLHGRYDVRTDVYGLGLVLYEMLTLRPAYSDPERGGLIRKIEQGVVTKPSEIRGEIPRDLETIVLHAIQHDPAHRYQTATELADDLLRFLEDRPVLARRANALEHAWRWCRRNRLVAGLASVALLSMVAGLIVSWSAYVEARRASQLANSNLSDALIVLEKTFDVAAGPDEFEFALDDSSGEASLEWVQPSQPSPEMAALLSSLLTFYDHFAETNSRDLRLDIAHAQRRVGDLDLRLGKGQEAVDAYQRALELFRQLDGDAHAHTATIAEILNGIGRAWIELRDPKKAQEVLNSALEDLQGVDSRPIRYERARTHELLASTFAPFRPRGPSGRPAQGDRPPSTDPREDTRPDSSPRRGPPEGATRGPQGRFNMRREMVEHLRSAWEIDSALAGEAPENAAFLAAVRRTSRLLLESLEFGGAKDERKKVIDADIARLEATAARFPKSQTIQLALAEAYLALAPRTLPVAKLTLDAEMESVRSRVDKASEITAKLYETAPDNVDVGRAHATAIVQKARLHPLDPARPGIDDLRKAAEILERFPPEGPLELGAPLFARLAVVQALLGQHEEEAAARELGRALRALEDLERRGGDRGRRPIWLLQGARPDAPPGPGGGRMMQGGLIQSALKAFDIDATRPALAEVLRDFEERRRRPR